MGSTMSADYDDVIYFSQTFAYPNAIENRLSQTFVKPGSVCTVKKMWTISEEYVPNCALGYISSFIKN